jgi:hypothetical protein
MQDLERAIISFREQLRGLFDKVIRGIERGTDPSSLKVSAIANDFSDPEEYF